MRIEQVTVGPVLNPVTPGIAPVIEHLTAEDMPSDAPLMLVAFCRKMGPARHQVIEVGNFEGDMMKLWRHARNRGEVQRMVIDRFVAPVTANEQSSQIVVGCAYFIGDQQAKAAPPPFPGSLHV